MTGGGVCFVDTETTGLDPDRHDIWEVGLIDVAGVEHRWFLPVALGGADAVALNIGGYHDRHLEGFNVDRTALIRKRPKGTRVSSPDWQAVMPRSLFAHQFARLTWGCHLAGAVISFDEERLRRLLRAHGQAPGWHYHLVDVEALAAGWLAGNCPDEVNGIFRPPWDSTDLSRAVGVDPELFDRHTALGDCRWAKAIYNRVMGK